MRDNYLSDLDEVQPFGWGQSPFCCRESSHAVHPHKRLRGPKQAYAQKNKWVRKIKVSLTFIINNNELICHGGNIYILYISSQVNKYLYILRKGEGEYFFTRSWSGKNDPIEMYGSCKGSFWLNCYIYIYINTSKNIYIYLFIVNFVGKFFKQNKNYRRRMHHLRHKYYIHFSLWIMYIIFFQ